MMHGFPPTSHSGDYHVRIDENTDPRVTLPRPANRPGARYPLTERELSAAERDESLYDDASDLATAAPGRSKLSLQARRK